MGMSTMPYFRGVPQFTPTIPKFYWEVESQEQRIKLMCYLIQQLIDTQNDYGDDIEELEKLIEQVSKDCESYTDTQIKTLDHTLRTLIADLQQGELSWDITTGKFTNAVDAQRSLFNDVTVHSITVDTLAVLDIDIDGLTECGLNVRGLAVFGGYLLGETFTPEGVFATDSPDTTKLSCALLAGSGVLNGYFVTGDIATDSNSVYKLSNAVSENGYIKEGGINGGDTND